MIRGFANFVLFVLALTSASKLVRSVQPPLTVPDFYPKVEFLAGHRSVDTLFVGSSRTLHHVIPAAFDAATERCGLQTRSFCLAVDGARPPESYFMLRTALAQTSGIKRVFIEVNRFEPRVTARIAASERFLHWHDIHHSALVLAHIATSDATLSEKWELVSWHVAALGTRISSLGRGQTQLHQRLFPAKMRASDPPRWIPTMGYLEPQSFPLEGQKLALFHAGLARLKKVPRIAPLPSVASSALSSIVADVRAAGAEPILFLPPTTDFRDWFTTDGIDAPCISFLDTEKFAELYSPALRNDYEHLNAAGAQRFTELLAGEFLRR